MITFFNLRFIPLAHFHFHFHCAKLTTIYCIFFCVRNDNVPHCLVYRPIGCSCERAKQKTSIINALFRCSNFKQKEKKRKTKFKRQFLCKWCDKWPIARNGSNERITLYNDHLFFSPSMEDESKWKLNAPLKLIDWLHEFTMKVLRTRLQLRPIPSKVNGTCIPPLRSMWRCFLHNNKKLLWHETIAMMQIACITIRSAIISNIIIFRIERRPRFDEVWRNVHDTFLRKKKKENHHAKWSEYK